MRTEFSNLEDFYRYVLEGIEDTGWAVYLGTTIKKNPPKFLQFKSDKGSNRFFISPDISPNRPKLKELQGKVIAINNQHYLVGLSTDKQDLLLELI